MDANTALRGRLRELAEERRRFGSPRLYLMLRREGWLVNHKRVERLYREERLSLRLKGRRKRPSHLRVAQPRPTGPDQHWAMDFMSDSLLNGRRVKVLTIVDLWDRRCLWLEADHSLTGDRVVRVLEQLRATGQRPKLLRTDNGPEFTGKALDAWARHQDVRLEFIRPGKPMENGHIESFNGRLREECLDMNVFTSLDETRRVLSDWRLDYNRVRPHSSLGGLAPEEFGRAVKVKTMKDQSPSLRLVYSKG